MKENLCKQISLDAIKYLEHEPDAFVLFYIFPLPFLLSKLCNSIASAVLLETSVKYLGMKDWLFVMFEECG